MKVSTLCRSFRHALRGIGYVFRHEQNFRIQLVCAIIVISVMQIMHLSLWEDIALWLVIVFVLTLELVNTAIEKFMDLLKPRLHEHVAIIKDVMAAAVLVVSIGAVIIGTIIFVPYIVEYFS